VFSLIFSKYDIFLIMECLEDFDNRIFCQKLKEIWDDYGCDSESLKRTGENDMSRCKRRRLLAPPREANPCDVLLPESCGDTVGTIDAPIEIPDDETVCSEILDPPKSTCSSVGTIDAPLEYSSDHSVCSEILNPCDVPLPESTCSSMSCSKAIEEDEGDEYEEVTVVEDEDEYEEVTVIEECTPPVVRKPKKKPRKTRRRFNNDKLVVVINCSAHKTT